MTVCISAICEDNTIICAADRMFIIGDVQWERKQTKIKQIADNVSVLFAGDLSTQDDLEYRLTVLIRKNPNLSVREIADHYLDGCTALRSKLSEDAILRPLGLTHETFAHDQNLSNALMDKLSKQLQMFPGPQVQAMIVGVDKYGPHIFIVVPDQTNTPSILKYNTIGFASIGIGCEHARMEFKMTDHSRSDSFAETLLRVYMAKRRSEIAPGVGTLTDMIVIGPAFESKPVAVNVIERLDAIYTSYYNTCFDSRKRASEEFTECLKEVPA